MDTDAIGDSVNKLKAIRMDNDEFADEVADEVDDDDDDDDFDDSDDEELEPITFGFLEKPKNSLTLSRQFFPSKAGGLPAWLDPLNIPSGKSSVCDFCGDPLQFLLQVYASVVEKESTFHRMLFVFMCPSMTCLLRDQHEQWKRNPEKPSRSVKVFRCQLPRINPFYSSECPKYDGSDKPTDIGAVLCDWCGTWKGNKLCSSCKQVRYCSEKHQTMSWRAGHKIACQQIKVSSPLCGPNKNGTTSPESCKVGNKSTWPEFEIIEDQSECNGDKSEDNTLANSLILRNRSDDTMNSLIDIFQGDDDKKSWAHFQERIAKAPEQVLRYYRNSNSKPIWPILSGRPSKDDIPKCIYCGGSMCCEFQILPQLLYYFGVENEVNSLDWASIVVYACEASCEASLPYKHEYAWVQLYSPSAYPMPQ